MKQIIMHPDVLDLKENQVRLKAMPNAGMDFGREVLSEGEEENDTVAVTRKPRTAPVTPPKTRPSNPQKQQQQHPIEIFSSLNPAKYPLTTVAPEAAKSFLTFNETFAAQHGIRPSCKYHNIPRDVDWIRSFLQGFSRSKAWFRHAFRTFQRRRMIVWMSIKRYFAVRRFRIESVLANWIEEEKQWRLDYDAALMHESDKRRKSAIIHIIQRFADVNVPDEAKRLVVTEVYSTERNAFLKQNRAFRLKVRKTRDRIKDLREYIDLLSTKLATQANPLAGLETEPSAVLPPQCDSVIERVKKATLAELGTLKAQHDSLLTNEPVFVFTPEIITFAALKVAWRKYRPHLYPESVLNDALPSSEENGFITPKQHPKDYGLEVQSLSDEGVSDASHPVVVSLRENEENHASPKMFESTKAPVSGILKSGPSVTSLDSSASLLNSCSSGDDGDDDNEASDSSEGRATSPSRLPIRKVLSFQLPSGGLGAVSARTRSLRRLASTTRLSHQRASLGNGILGSSSISSDLEIRRTPESLTFRHTSGDLFTDSRQAAPSTPEPNPTLLVRSSSMSPKRLRFRVPVQHPEDNEVTHETLRKHASSPNIRTPERKIEGSQPTDISPTATGPSPSSSPKGSFVDRVRQTRTLRFPLKKPLLVDIRPTSPELMPESLSNPTPMLSGPPTAHQQLPVSNTTDGVLRTSLDGFRPTSPVLAPLSATPEQLIFSNTHSPLTRSPSKLSSSPKAAASHPLLRSSASFRQSNDASGPGVGNLSHRSFSLRAGVTSPNNGLVSSSLLTSPSHSPTARGAVLRPLSSLRMS